MTRNNVFLKTLNKPLENPIGLFGLPIEMKFLNVSDIMTYEEKFLKTRNIKGKLDKIISNTVSLLHSSFLSKEAAPATTR